MSGHRAEWHGASDFAEVAEAIGVPTIQIVGTIPRDAHTFVVYSDAKNERYWAARLVRGADGILARSELDTEIPDPFGDGGLKGYG